MQAIAEVISGLYSPGGLTTLTWVPAEFTKLASFRDMAMRPHGTMPGRTYRFLDESKLAPVFRFGHGLSYTQWKLAFVQAPGAAAVGILQPTEWVLSVRNIGSGGRYVPCVWIYRDRSLEKY